MTTMQPVPTLRRQDFALALAGPAVVGVVMSLSGSIGATPLLLPLVFLGVMALLLPSLYIGLAFVGSAISLRTLGNTAVEALRDSGVALLGVAPAVLFLDSTTASHESLTVPYLLLFGGAAFLTVRRMCVRLSQQSVLGPGLVTLLAGWTVVAVGLGVWLTFTLRIVH